MCNSIDIFCRNVETLKTDAILSKDSFKSKKYCIRKSNYPPLFSHTVNKKYKKFK